MIALAILSIAGAADARPKRRDAKAAFERGLAAYKAGNFEAAAQSLSRSFELERDVDTLFAWAQAQRKLEHCAQAIDLYKELLGFDLPAKNREAVERNIADCRAIIAAQTPEPAPVAPPPPPPVAARVESPPVAARVEPPPVEVVARPGSGALSPRPWYRDPVGIGMLSTGVVATGVGAGLLVSARALDSDYHDQPTIDDAIRVADRAKTRGTLGLIAAGAGGALLIGGVVWIVTHRHATEQRMVTGWLAPAGGGGLAVTGAF